MQASGAFTMRKANPNDFPVVMRLLEESIAWLRSKGSDQWSTWPKWQEKMAPSLARGDVWLLCNGKDLIGTVTVELHGDAGFWTEDELAEPAEYVSKLAVRRDHAGHELGAGMLAWAGGHAWRYGCRWLRLDAWKTNDALHAYYRTRGWTHLRTVANAERFSGALFQVAAQADVSPHPFQEAATVNVVPTTLANSGIDGPNESGSYVPHHMHQAVGLTVDYEALAAVRPALFVGANRYRVREIDGVWSFEYDGYPGRSWVNEGRVADAGDMSLVSGVEYVFTHHDGDPCGIEVTEVRR